MSTFFLLTLADRLMESTDDEIVRLGEIMSEDVVNLEMKRIMLSTALRDLDEYINDAINKARSETP